MAKAELKTKQNESRADTVVDQKCRKDAMAVLELI